MHVTVMCVCACVRARVSIDGHFSSLTYKRSCKSEVRFKCQKGAHFCARFNEEKAFFVCESAIIVSMFRYMYVRVYISK